VSDPNPRLALVGLDLGDRGLLEAWADRGRLPHLARLAAHGVTRSLASSADTLHVSAWPSLYTGASPGEHGVYFTFQPLPGEQGHRRFHSGLYGRPTFWNLLGSAGTACSVLDAPYTHEEEGPGVTQIIDWGAWAQYLGPRSDPSTVLRALKRDVGDYPLGMEAHDMGLEAIDASRIGPALVRSAAAKTEAALWMLRNHPAPLFFMVYGEPHAAAHYCWPPGMDAADARAAIEAGGTLPSGLDQLLALYEAIDAGIGRIAEALQDVATLCVFSPDAVGPNYGGWHLLPEVLRRLGYLVEPGPHAGEEAESARPGLLRRFRDLLPKDFRKSLARRLPTGIRDRLARQVDTAFVDWSRTRAFCLPTDLEGCIRINLSGREPRGIVPRHEYDSLCAKLASDLLELVDSRGRNAVREVVEVHERYPGPRVEHLPDLVVLWEDAGQLCEVRSDRVGRVKGTSPDGRPGTHATPGFLIAHGPDAQRWASVVDVREIARVALETFGVGVPDYMQERQDG